MAVRVSASQWEDPFLERRLWLGDIAGKDPS